MLTNGRVRATLLLIAIPALLVAQRGRSDNPFPGGTNPDGSLRPTPPVTRLFTQDAYTEYAILEPGSQSFRIRFLPEETRAGATELVNATRGGSEGSDVEVFDPRTGRPLPFTYEHEPNDPETHAIHAKLPIPVPEGGVGRVLIYKTYKDPRTYLMHGDDIVWVRSLSGYRLGVLLPKGFAFISSNVAAQVTTVADGRLKLAFANPSGQSHPVTIHARKTTAAFTPRNDPDMFFDDVKTVYDLGAPEASSIKIEQIYSDVRRGDAAKLDTLAYLPLQDLKVVDLDTAKTLTPVNSGPMTSVKLDVPIVNDKQSAHLKITGTLKDPAYTIVNGDLVFERTLHGLRNTVLLPAGWEVSRVSQSGTIGTYRGRPFVALINLNSENRYTVAIRARKGAATSTPMRESASARRSIAIDLWKQGKPAFGVYAPNENPGPRGQGPRRAVYTRGGGEKLAMNPLVDFVFLNLEGAYDADALGAIARGLRDPSATGRKTLIVRIPSIETAGDAATKARVKEAFDLGADGVTIPHVRGVDEAKQAIGFFHDARANVWSPSNPSGDTIAMLMLEDPDAVAQAKAVAEVQGISILACGIGSLTQALGGDRAGAEAGTQRVLMETKRARLVNMLTASPQDVEKRVKEGFLALLTQGQSADETIRLGRAAAGR
ncbi:MAG TPA: aldolase/citrate lyase family protein [Vicinamibacterales bacterium]|jgi:2-keto-3-deoxy-L-rhamnonate aldolase RhmA|nr:aldolase/citrate lyase family protein [Vicinamibacterales bacterium]